MSRRAQCDATALPPGRAPLGHDLMRDAQLAGYLRRDHSPPKQLSRLYAALFHHFQITPRPRPTLRRT